MTKIDTILHPTDFSEPAEYAFQLACSLARDHNARLFVLHVIPPPQTHGEVLARASPDSYRDQLWRKLAHMKPSESTVKVEHLLEEGHPAEVIVQAAKENCSDLIVMGTHGRGGLRRLLMGSVAEEVLREASCPVLTVRSHIPAVASAAAERGPESVRS
jgi:nucleotide-binding universal stress UspA family protein